MDMAFETLTVADTVTILWLGRRLTAWPSFKKIRKFSLHYMSLPLIYTIIHLSQILTLSQILKNSDFQTYSH